MVKLCDFQILFFSRYCNINNSYNFVLQQLRNLTNKSFFLNVILRKGRVGIAYLEQ